MTKLLENALEQVRKLPAAEQDAIAALILDELADERLWEEKFAGTQDKLARLAAGARADVAAGRVREAGIDEL
jgi:hypothetical protein